MEKPEGKRPLGRPRHRWEYNIKIGLQVVGYEGMDWIYQVDYRDRWWTLVDEVSSIRVLQNAGDFVTILELASFSRRTLLHGVSK